MSPLNPYHLFIALLASILLLARPIQATSESEPNPIHDLYPTFPTGTLNLTVSILPIPLSLARSIIPSQYPILTTAYLPLLPPSWDPTTYPLLIETRFDHDIYYLNIPGAVPDFQAVSILFPFVDRLGDGYSSFVYINWQLVSWDVAVAIEGSAAYGTIVEATRFEPDLEGYEFEGKGGEERSFRGFVASGNLTSGNLTSGIGNSTFDKLAMETRFVDDGEGGDECGIYGMDFYKNITNQPLFSNNATVCDNQIVLYNTTLSTGANAPVPIISDIFIDNPFFPGGLNQNGVKGIRVDTAWIEKNFLDCETLQGYGSDGNGD